MAWCDAGSCRTPWVGTLRRPSLPPSHLHRWAKIRPSQRSGNLIAVLRIRDVYPGSWIRLFHPGSWIRTVSIPDAGSRIRIKELKYFNPKKWFLSSRKYVRAVHPGFRIRMMTFYPSRIQGSKRHRITDPGSGSATLIKRVPVKDIYHHGPRPISVFSLPPPRPPRRCFSFVPAFNVLVTPLGSPAKRRPSPRMRKWTRCWMTRPRSTGLRWTSSPPPLHPFPTSPLDPMVPSIWVTSSVF